MHFDLAAIRLGSELDHGMQRNVKVRQLLAVLVVEVGEDAAQYGLVRYDEHVGLTLQLHDYRLKPRYEILVTLNRFEQYSFYPTAQCSVPLQTDIGSGTCPCRAQRTASGNALGSPRRLGLRKSPERLL